MPLKDEQKEVIEMVLMDFDFSSTNENDFYLKENLLSQTFNGVVDTNHEYYFISECFLNPEAYFREIEIKGPLVTLAEVQEYIFEYVIQKLNESGHPLRILNQEFIQTHIPKENRAISFEGKKARVDTGENSWFLANPEDSIYTQLIDYAAIYNLNNLYISITVNCGSDAIHKKYFQVKKLLGNFPTLAEEITYIDASKEEAASAALKEAALIAIQHIAKLHRLENTHTQKIIKNEATFPLITHTYYFNLLVNKEIQFSDIENFNPEIINRVCSRNIVSLIKDKLITLQEASRLSKFNVNVINHPTYFAMMQKKEMVLWDLKDMTKKKMKLLVNHCVLSLLEMKKISLRIVNSLPVFLRKIFANKHYKKYFISQDKIDWSNFKTIPNPHHLLLLDERITLFVTNKVLSFKDISCLTNVHHDNPNLLEILYLEAFAIRLLKVLYGTPCQLNSVDTFEIVLNELPDAAQECGVDVDAFKNSMFYCLIKNLKSQFESKISILHKKDIQLELYEAMVNLIVGETQNPFVVWSEVFKELIILADYIKERLTKQKYTVPRDVNMSLVDSSDTLFSRPQKKQRINEDNFLYELCENLIALQPALVAINQEGMRRQLQF